MALQPTSIPDFGTTALYGDQNHTNATECPDQDAWDWVSANQPVYILIISVLGIVLNVFVLMVFCLHKKPCTVAEIYLSNLAAADLVLVSCLPFWAVSVSNDFNWPFGQFLCKAVNLGIKMNASCSIYFLVLVSIDRYVALVHTMSHGRMRRPKYAKLGCLLVWLLGLLLSAPTLIFRQVRHFPEYGEGTMENATSAEPVCNGTDAWDWIYTMQPAYMSVICFVGVVGNSFVLCMFCAQKRRTSVADIYLSNLAVADLLMVSCLPFWVANTINEFHWTFGEPLCQLVNIVIGMNYYCSVLFLTLVSVDRYLALTRPLTQGRERRACRARGICFGIWVVGIFLSLPAILFRSVQFFPDLGIHACYVAYPHEGWRLRYNITINIVCFLIPVPIVSFCSYHITKAIRSSQKLRQGNTESVERKAAYLVLVVLVVFILCWLPYQILTFLDTLDYYKVISGCTWAYVLDIGNQLASYLGYSNSSLNPFLYVIVGKHFKQRTREVLRLVQRKKKKQGRRSGISNTILTSTKQTESSNI
ncbi:hypothetical protein Q5P01_020132 [Channa striata]|uniref:B2 bradykinin receptor n=1 Tax=Channa striata TaxID=64152 RepID=A0AA88LX43_CHASR|nr:hypothetical protein Q5P01_020132 [Channa striata]